MLTKENYFNFGTGSTKEALISASSLKYLYPGQGGSYELFKHYLANYDAEKEKTKHNTSLRFGKVFHSYLEDKDSFKVADFTRPSDAIVNIIEHVFSLVDNIPLSEAHYEILEAIKVYPYGGANWKPETVINRIVESGNEYYEHLKESNGKVVITDKEKETLENVINSWIESPFYVDFSQKKFEKEVPIEWQYHTKLGNVRCKSLLDNVNHGEGEFIDFKTNGKTEDYILRSDYRMNPSSGLLEEVKVSGPGITYRVYRQVAFYKEALKYIFNRNYNHSIIVFQTVPPYKIDRYIFHDNHVQAGLHEIHQSINEFAQGLLSEMNNEY